MPQYQLFGKLMSMKIMKLSMGSPQIKEFCMIVPENSKLKEKLNSLEMVGKLKENHGGICEQKRKDLFFAKK